MANYYDREIENLGKGGGGFHPWSFSGIMSEIQHTIYNNEGMDDSSIEYRNLIQRIESLKSGEKERAYSELYKAKSIAKKRHDIWEKEYKAEKAAEKKDACDTAKKRYKSLSLFGKIKYFKQRPNKINYTEATVDELKQLYR